MVANTIPTPEARSAGMINVKHLVSAMHKSLVTFVTEIQTNQVKEKMTNSKAKQRHNHVLPSFSSSSIVVDFNFKQVVPSTHRANLPGSAAYQVTLTTLPCPMF